MNTFCPQLWDGYYINRAGDVYPCCHQNPMMVGNIRDAPLSQIVNDPPAVEARRQSVAGSLACFARCTLLDKASLDRPSIERLTIPYGELRRLHISFGEACNIRCTMCAHPGRHAANPLVLETEIVIRNVDPAPFEEIVLQGGEPLYVRPCLDYMRYLEGIGKRYTLLTNGLLIVDSTALRLARHAKVVSISINGASKRTHETVNRGSRFERILGNIQRLRSARTRLGTDLVVSGRMTLTVDNVHEIPLFLRTFRAMGFDRVNFGYVRDSVPGFLAAHPELRSELAHETHIALREVGGQDVDPLRLRQLGLLVAQQAAREPAPGLSEADPPPSLAR